MINWKGDFELAARTDLIWKEFSGNLKLFILKRVQNEHDAEDILQDVFIKIHKKIHNLNDEDKLEAWLYQITRNTIIDYYRHRKKDTEDFQEIEDFQGINEGGIDATTATGTIDNTLSCIKPMIHSLPDKYRQAIILTEYEGFTQREMAERLGLSLSGAKSRVQRAREKLKEMLLECCSFEFDRLGNILDYRLKNNTDSCCSGEQAKE